jgi:tRNA A37 methylthiotransferase MiaB
MNETEFVTFGCRLNTYESEVMRGHAAKAGLKNAIVFNTCAVTAEATRQARIIRKAHKANPAKIIVTGQAPRYLRCLPKCRKFRWCLQWKIAAPELASRRHDRVR